MIYSEAVLTELVGSDVETGGMTDPADPRLFIASNAQYTRWRFVDGQGLKIRLCHTSRRNPAGFYVSFREESAKRGVWSRSDYEAHSVWREATARSARMADEVQAALYAASGLPHIVLLPPLRVIDQDLDEYRATRSDRMARATTPSQQALYAFADANDAFEFKMRFG